MKKEKLIVVIGLLLFSLAIEAQITESAQKNYEQFSYAQVIDELEAAEDPSPEALRLMANSAYMMKDLDKAEGYFNQLLGHQQPAEDIHTYANVLRMQGKYPEAKAQMDEFCKLVPEDSRAIAHKRNGNYFVTLLQDNGQYVIANHPVNTNQQELAPSYYQDQVVFASNRRNVKRAGEKWEGNDMPYLDIFMLHQDSEDADERSLFNPKMKRDYNIGPVVFNEKGDYMIFTRNSSEKDKNGSAVHLQLFESTKTSSGWTDAKALPYNSESYNVGHATLAEDGRVMYFVSDMPGGIGGVDIYRCERDADGNWGAAVNLGSTINTEGDEMFPFIHPMGVMTFASNGHQGLGGLDIFSVWIDEPNSVISNLGVPLNSQSDDFGMIFNDDMTSGYFSSDRAGGHGSDDIYSFTMTPMSKATKQYMTVVDQSGAAIPFAEVEVKDEGGNTIETVIADENGELYFNKDKASTLVAHSDHAELGVMDVGAVDSDTPIAFRVDNPNSIAGRTAYIGTGNPQLTYPNTNTAQSAGVSVNTSSGAAQPNGGSATTTPNTTASSTYTTPTQRYANAASSAKAFEQALASDNLAAMGLRVGGDLDPAGIYPIHYDISGAMFNEQALAELQKILDLMQRFPDMRIQAISYTDCRSTVAYNDELSDKRARAVYDWFSLRLDDASRVKSFGVGESILVNDCPCGFTDLNNRICSEEEHKMNRRTEFKIIGL